MIRDAYAWLRDMAAARVNPPPEVIAAARAQQGVPYVPGTAVEAMHRPADDTPAPAPMAATGQPAWARHTIPPQQSATFRGPQYGCVGLCPGGTCATCDGLADEITAARRIRVPAIREVREGALLRRINNLREGR